MNAISKCFTHWISICAAVIQAPEECRKFDEYLGIFLEDLSKSKLFEEQDNPTKTDEVEVFQWLNNKNYF